MLIILLFIYFSFCRLKTISDFFSNDEDVGHIIQFTDAHVQFEYVVGGDPDCKSNSPECCYEKTSEQKHYSGKFGYYNTEDQEQSNFCCIPKISVENIVDYIVGLTKNYSIDSIVFSGDIVSQNLQKQKLEDNLEHLDYFYDLMKKKIPTNVQFLPVLGNHDTFPIEYCDWPGKSYGWLYENFSKWWEPFLSEEQISSVKNLISYTHYLEPNLKVITLNSLLITPKNKFWEDATEDEKHLIYNYLKSELEKSRIRGDKVILSQHIALENRIYWVSEEWLADYRSILKEYGDIIILDMNGHYHTDYPQLINEKDKHDVIGVQMISNALVPWSLKVFPAVRVYKYDKKTYEILDYIHIVNDMEKSNKEGSMDNNWYISYSAKEDLKLKDFTPSSFSEWWDRLRTNKDDYNLFLKMYHADYMKGEYCESQCKVDLLCKIRYVDKAMYEICRNLPIWNNTL